MRIGYEAKRIYQNTTGLGNYSRTLVTSLAEFFPGNEYLLFAPKLTSLFDEKAFENIHSITPDKYLASHITALWRSRLMTKDIEKQQTDVFHGLSSEVPYGIADTKAKSVVSIADLIYERYPEQYKAIDIRMYRMKAKYACKTCDAVIAVSEQTKRDIIELYHVPEEKIKVCYQSCGEQYSRLLTEKEKSVIRERYRLPAEYYLYVGSIIERKDLLTVCKAIKLLHKTSDIPLVVIGNGGSYKERVKTYAYEEGISHKVIFLNDHIEATNPGFQSGEDFPGIYQMACAFIYPSVYEGFGIPVLEALNSETPVITTNVSCMPETGGDAALYINPHDEHQLAEHMQQIAHDKALAKSMKEKGLIHAQKFDRRRCAEAVMAVYESIL